MRREGQARPRSRYSTNRTVTFTHKVVEGAKRGREGLGRGLDRSDGRTKGSG